jgi:drug/metabolite transporter (DMT)-like permease
MATVQDGLPSDIGGTGWTLVVALALLSTVVAITALAAGTARVGPSTATIIATIVPMVATVLAFIVLDERLSALQLVGGGLIVLSVLIVGSGVGRRAPGPPIAPAPPG